MFNVSFDAYMLQHQFNQYLNLLVEEIRFRPGMSHQERSFMAWELLALNSEVFWEINATESPTMPEGAN